MAIPKNECIRAAAIVSHEVRVCFIFAGPGPERWLLDPERKRGPGFGHKELK